MLTVTTTHLKMGWIRRNGVPRSDSATLVEHFVRHGDYLTLISWINDPVYLEEPFVRTTNWALDPHQNIAAYPCGIVVEVDRPQGTVPHHLPGSNTFLNELPANFNATVNADHDHRTGGLRRSLATAMPPAPNNAQTRRSTKSSRP